MMFDYDKEEQDFLAELESGEFPIEVLANKGPIRKEKEAADIAAFESYLASEDYKSFTDGVFKK